jgi:hypothetical protein
VFEAHLKGPCLWERECSGLPGTDLSCINSCIWMKVVQQFRRWRGPHTGRNLLFRIWDWGGVNAWKSMEISRSL